LPSGFGAQQISWHAHNVGDASTMGDPVVIAHVDDHETVQLGFAALIAPESDLELRLSAPTIEPVLERLAEFDLIVLDLRLSDGSSVESNMARLIEGGAQVLAFTAGDDRLTARAASRAGALGIIRKSASAAAVLEAVRSAAHGIAVPTTEWAAAVDADPELAAAKLSPKEREVLALYAAGEKSITVADRAGLSPSTVAEYVRRIRQKYAKVGRPAYSKVDLYKRAVEDGILSVPE
jgi:two-component system, NarL family, response regulator DevR